MKHLIIYAHPDNGSINHTLLEAARETLLTKGDKVVVRDLYALGFNPILSLNDMAGQRTGTVAADVATEQEYITDADNLIFIYPIWWTGMPAILKGFIDRVMSYGFAYKYDKGLQQGLIAGKTAYIINTHGKSHAEYQASGMDKALQLTSDNGIFIYCGLKVVTHFYFDQADKASADKIASWQNDLVTSLLIQQD